MSNELEQLIQGVLGPTDQETSLLGTFMEGSDTPGFWHDPARLAVDVNRLMETATQQRAVNELPTTSTRTTSSSPSEGSIGETLLKSAAMMTGVGPVVTGLMKLFGSDEPEPLPALEKFAAPAPVSVEAGLTQDRRYSTIRYGTSGTPEATQSPSQRGAEGPTVQVNIQAMDSQSFLDRQDDIARAVREAMLHSSSLNDVVMEL
jgi:hypothetical protein